jgi:hypothetical protein
MPIMLSSLNIILGEPQKLLQENNHLDHNSVDALKGLEILQ